MASKLSVNSQISYKTHQTAEGTFLTRFDPTGRMNIDIRICSAASSWQAFVQVLIKSIRDSRNLHSNLQLAKLIDFDDSGPQDGATVAAKLASQVCCS